jgi:predicted permease
MNPREFWARLATWIRRPALERNLAAELDAHLELSARELEAEGLSTIAATTEARRRFGSLARAREASRDAWGFPALDGLARDIRQAVRGLVRSPIYSATIVLMLALGIGANTAVFSFLNGLFLTTAPVSDPETLYSIFSRSDTSAELRATSFQNYEDLQRALRFDIAAHVSIPVALADDAREAEQVPAALVSSNYFRVLGVHAQRGRAFTAGEGGADGQNPVIVISHSLWQRRFGGQAVLGRRIAINTRPFTVIGVAPEGFRGIDVGKPVDVWIPSSMHGDALTGVQTFYFRQRSAAMFDLVARLPTSSTAAELESSLHAQANILADRFPADDKGLSFHTIPLRQAQLGPAHRADWMRAAGLLALIVALVLLIACANVANLALARILTRRHEISLRLALGASRAQIRRYLTAESGVLAIMGAVTGLAVARGSIQLATLVRPSSVLPAFTAAIDGRVLAFTAAVACVVMVLVGVGPALYMTSGVALGGIHRDRFSATRLSRGYVARGLLVVQSALATIALIFAALFVRSLRNAQLIDPGFRVNNLALVTFNLGMLRYDNERGPAFVRRVNERMKAIPGIVSSAVASHVVLDDAGLESRIHIAGHVSAEAIGVHAEAVGLNYFQTMALVIREGRAFQPGDDTSSKYGWAVVNETMAERIWPNRSPIGERFAITGIPEPYVVVGVASNSQYEALGEKPQPFFYIYYDQTPGLKKLTLYVRTAVDPASVLPAIVREIRSLDRNLPLTDVRTMGDVLTKATWASRAASVLLGSFGALALALALVGIYGVTAFFVNRQRRDIGIRMALGASPRNAIAPIIRSTFVPAVAGTILGALVAAVGARSVAGLLVGVSPNDPLSICAAATILLGCAGAASLLPVGVALRRDPITALRGE